MTTALDIINDALDDITVKSAEVDLTELEIASAIRKMNRMVTNWAQGGLNLGYTKIVDETDLITVPDWAEELLSSQLAIRLAPSFGVMVSQEIVAIARDSMTRALRSSIQLEATAFPSTLPVGAGNTQNNRIFFPPNNAGDLQTNSAVDMLNDVGDNLSVD